MAIFSRNDDGKKDGKRSRTLPLLPLRDIIVFPHMVVPLFVGRQKSIAALEEAMGGDKSVLLCAQKKAKTNEPTPEQPDEAPDRRSARMAPPRTLRC